MTISIYFDGETKARLRYTNLAPNQINKIVSTISELEMGGVKIEVNDESSHAIRHDFHAGEI